MAFWMKWDEQFLRSWHIIPDVFPKGLSFLRD